MTIDWYSLGLVSLVTIVVSILFTILVSFSANCIDKAENAVEAHQRAIGQKFLAAVSVAVVFAIIVFGLWLMIPYFH